MGTARAVGLFLAAALAEIGGGYLMWHWLREGGPWPLGLAGAVTLAVYGVIPTLQHATFGRTYAAYGGVFVIASLLWGWGIDHNRPGRYEWIGAAIIALGVALLFFGPRAGHNQQPASPPAPAGDDHFGHLAGHTGSSPGSMHRASGPVHRARHTGQLGVG